jgi:phenylalanyl-tRNA synthetase, alpha subunit
MLTEIKTKLEQIEQSAAKKISAADTLSALESLRIEFLGKKAELSDIMKLMGKLTAEERPLLGELANKTRAKIETELTEKKTTLAAAESQAKLVKEKIDVTEPSANKRPRGGLHPLNVVLEEIKEIFFGMGFSAEEGPEIEDGYHNFDALNIPADHPARDEQDTFYIADTESLMPNEKHGSSTNTEQIRPGAAAGKMLRTATSTVQIRHMEQNAPPIRIIVPGRVFRADTVDATHSPLFNQIEGLAVDKGITFASLKGTLEDFCKSLYGDDCVVRFRPHYFPFTEPSAELDIQCHACGGKGCRMCKNEGWIEVLGCGMVHPNVLKTCGIDPDVYSGFAFGMGLERLTMRKFGITDLRLFYENDIAFLRQFS